MDRINLFLPEISGRRLKISLDEFEKSCLVQLGLLPHRTSSGRELGRVLRNAVKLSRYLSDVRKIVEQTHKAIDLALAEIRKPVPAQIPSAEFNRRTIKIVQISSPRSESLGANE